ncbi:UDP-2,3-diacylglucosamine diphosphatase [Betaproteobacteria bacterium SCN2]|jgi:UDP-2,3-diacylglucosamine pyrophosphatase LpxH|nr:UDP-2,3-diacylglucosamine diphosphatase [Betaproteobacteria bacterium SCN2]
MRLWLHAHMLTRVMGLLRSSTPPAISVFTRQETVSFLVSSLDPGGEPPPEKTRRYRTLWISDIHLGTPGCQAQYLLDFLRHNDSDTLYLVGDIIDGWQLRRGWYWPQAHNDVVQKILRKARKGTRVVYVPGNHDEMARQFAGLAFGEIEVAEDIVHVTADGRKLLVTHGDLFDGVMQHARWLAYVGDSLYTLTLVLNRWFNWARAHFGYSYWSLSQYLKHKVKNAVSFITAFERVMTEEARRRNCDGVVCGHIHKAEIRTIDDIVYCNDGDWVESLSALAETFDGELQIIYWTKRLDSPARKRRSAVTVD